MSLDSALEFFELADQLPITHLNISNNMLGNAPAPFLSDFALVYLNPLSTITHLDISNNNIDSEGVISLIKSAQMMPNFVTLNISKNALYGIDRDNIYMISLKIQNITLEY